MKRIYLTKKWKFFINVLILCVLSQSAFQLKAQSEPFNCDYSAYLFQYADVYAIDLASGRSYLVAEEIVPGSINATAYNPKDGYIWGYLSTPSKSIVRIGKDFSTEIYTMPELTSGNKYVGAINSEGIYYFRSGSATYYSIDLNPDSETFLDYLGEQNLSKKISIHDWAFNAVDNKLYAVEKGTNRLYRITAETGEMEDLGVVPILAGLNYTFGAVYFDASGNFYVSANQSGSVYIINEVQGINGEIRSNIFAYGPASSSNDGARCPTAPVPQEDCSNGKDDDGDGLVDCNDPSCSGIQECPVTYTSSTANKGGLESNDRLADRIGRRNYQRAKDNYVFDASKAKRLKKGTNYRKSNISSKTNSISLESLVPIGVINEGEVVESSAADLLDLTNASDIYSVDYMSDGNSIGALMVIRTDEQVYEHSKFICDRFLGAELLSVSTVQLREQNFIKSIIKQPDGSLEFALTFSGRLTTDNQFVIESHWNIDAYAKDAFYYNFQIWASSLDDLLSLGEEVLALLELNGPISTYNASKPPPVFVKSAKYQNGEVVMNLVNNNNSSLISLEGGIKRTETSQSEAYTSTSAVSGYLDSLRIETGNLFDLGFRISDDRGSTPDDLFVADAPWGLDDSAETSSAETYKVLPNDVSYMGEGYRIERNVYLKGRTSEYIGVYRALSPRFSAVDLSAFDKFVFEASGTGTLDIKLLKGSGTMLKAKISLTSENTVYVLNKTDFTEGDFSDADFSDLKVISLELHAENSKETEKELKVQNIEFTNQDISPAFVLMDVSKAVVMPNPLADTTKLYFYEELAASYIFNVFTVNGTVVSNQFQEGDSVKGQNEIEITRKNLSPGIYFYNLASTNDKTWSGRIIVK